MSTYKNTSKDRKLLDEVRDVMRLHHYSIHTERTYCDWIKRYIRYHSMTNRQDLRRNQGQVFILHSPEDSVKNEDLTPLFSQKGVAP